MSLKCLTWAWAQESITDQTDLLVMLALADHADERDQCFPSQGLLARKARCSPDTVQRALKRLEAGGYVTRTRRGGSGAGRSSDLYQLHVDRAPVNGTATAPSPSTQHRKMRSSHEKRAQPGDNPGDNATDDGGAKPQNPGGAIPHLCAAGTSKEPPEPSLLLNGSGSEVGSPGKTPAAAKPMLTIRPGSAAWYAWMQHLERLKRSDVIELCTKHSVIQATQLWPKGDILPLRI